jgi:DNA-binding GntR family transcriptional regulator
VAESLREAILAGTFKPGERLVEQKLAARFGVGQPTLREALKELEFQGFVRKSPNHGTHVTQLTPEEFCKILEVRMALEIVTIERAAVRLTDEVVTRLEGAVDDMAAAAASFDLATFHKSDLRFHREIWDLAGNEYLVTALERVAFGLFAFVLLQRPRQSGNEFLAAAEQHREILTGLRSRNPAIARDTFIRATNRFWSTQHHVCTSVPPDDVV